MIKRILVPTDGSDAAMTGVRYATALAKRCEASLLGLHVVDVKLLEGPLFRDISASLGTAPYVNYRNNIASILEERGAAALRALEEIAREAEVPVETVQVTGVVPRAIVDKSDLADLIVMGRGGEHSEWLEGLIGSTTEAVARRSRQPVLITGTEAPGFQRLVVAYDGSKYASMALRTGVAISAEFNMALHLLVVGDERMDEIEAEAVKYLEAHQPRIERVRRSGEAGEVITAYAQEAQADLVVMGAYGHTKMRELFTGSTTSYTINHAPCPVLLAR